MEVCEQPMQDISASVDHGLLRNGTKEKIFEELQHQIDVNCISENGDTVLHSILRNEKLVQKDVVEFLTLCLARGIDPNKRGKDEETALHLAIERRMKEAVNCLLERAADRHVVDQRGNGLAHFFIEDECDKMKMAMLYPLMNTPENRKITENCSLDFASFLLSVGVDFGQKNKDDKSALDLTIMYNLPHLLPVLLERTNIKDYEKLIQILLPNISSTSSFYSAGEMSVCHSKYDTVLRLLVDRALADNNVKLRRRIVSTAIDAKNIWLLDLLRELSVISVNFELREGKNLLCIIAEQMDCKDTSSFEFYQQIVNVMVRSGCDLNKQDRYGKTALQTAIDYGKVSMIRILIDSGVDLNLHDRYRRTALHRAVTIGKPIDSTARSSMREFRPNRIDFSRHMEDVDYLNYERELLVESGEWPVSHLNRIEEQALMIVEMLVKSGVDVNARDSMRNTALHIAVFHDDVQMVRLLLRSSDVDLNAKDNEGNTPLQLIFVSKGKLKNGKDMAMMLLKRGACVNVQNMRMETPLELALLYDTGSTVIELLRYNANLMNNAYIRQLLRYIHDVDLEPQVRANYVNRGIFQCLQHHWMKLMAADLPLDGEYRNYIAVGVDEEYYEQCLKEIEELKKILIDDEQSLYDFLHMDPRRRCTYLQRENLQRVVESSNLVKIVPEISVLVMASYQEAKMFQKRETISVVVSEIFFEMYNDSHQNVVEKIVGYLREDDLLF